MDFELRFDFLLDPKAFDDLSENEEEGNDREKLEETFEHEAFDDEVIADAAFKVVDFWAEKSFRGGIRDLFDVL